MDESIFISMMALAESRPLWLVSAAFVFALLESLAIIGIFIPGIVLLFLVGAAIGLDPTLFLWCWAAAAAGAWAGDLFSYWLGRRFSDRIPGIWPLSRRPDMLASGQLLFSRHGGKAVFVGRFVGPIRPVVPLIAGTMALRPALFLAFAVPAGLLWAPLYLLPGMLFGASLELAAEFAGRLVLLLLIVVLGTWFVLWLTRTLYEFTARRSGWWLKGLIRWAHRHPLAGRLVGDWLEPGRHQVIPVALLGLILAASLVTLLSILIVTPLAQPTWDVERQLGSIAASLRSHFADPFFVAWSLAGELSVSGLLAGFTGMLLVVIGRRKAAWHWVAAVVGGWLLAEMIAGTMGLLLPAAEGEPTLAELPHRAYALSTVVLGFFALLIAKDLTARRRKWPYLATAALLAMIGFAHFYLGRASFIGLLGALALGMGWLALVGISYRRRAIARTRPTLLILVFYLALLMIAGAEVGRGAELLRVQTQLEQPLRTKAQAYWWDQGWRELPEKRSRLGSAPYQRFDFQLAADLDEWSAALERSGWQQPDIVSPWRLLSRPVMPDDGASAPHLPRDFAGRPEDLMLVLDHADGQRTVLRLWDSGTRLTPDAVPLWLGQARRVRLEPGLAGLQRWREQVQDRSEAVDDLLEVLSTQAWRRPQDGLLLISWPDHAASQLPRSAEAAGPDARMGP